jgi:hypothetical protein
MASPEVVKAKVSGRPKAIFSVGAIGTWLASKIDEKVGEFLNVALISRTLVVVLLWWLGNKLLRKESRPMVPALATQGFEVVQFILIVLTGQAALSDFLVGVVLCSLLLWLAMRPGTVVVGFLVLFQVTGIGWNVWQVFQPEVQQAHSETFGRYVLAAVLSQVLLRVVSIALLLIGLADCRSQENFTASATA